MAKKKVNPGSKATVSTRLAVVETDMTWVKDKLKSIDNKLWALIMAAIAAALAALLT